MIQLSGPALSVAVLIAAFVAIIMLDAYHHRNYIKMTSIIGVLLALAALFIVPIVGFGTESAATSTLIKTDMFTFVFSAIALIIAALVVISSQESTAVYNGSIILSAIGMVLVAGANDLILLYVSIELVTVPTYVLVAYQKTSRRMEAGMKYFIVSMLASALLLLGVGALSIAAGTTTISAMTFSASPLYLLGIGALIAGIGFKMGVFPFNFWIPDVYQGAPAEISGFLAGATKKAAYAGFLRVAVVLAALHSWSMIFALLAALTMTIPNIIALLQTDVRRMLAYSSMSHAGFLLIGIACATQIGYGALIFHAFTHAMMIFGAFLVIGVFAAHKIETIDGLKGIGWRNQFLGISLTIFLLSLAGIPIMAGFASKFYLGYAAASSGLMWLLMLLVLNSIISLYYYFKVIRALYGGQQRGATFTMHRGTVVAILVCLVLTVIAGVYPAPFIALATKAAAALG